MVGLIHEFTYYCVLESGLKQPEHLQFLVAITAEQIKRTYTIRVGELNESGLVVKAGNAIGDCLAAEGNFFCGHFRMSHSLHNGFTGVDGRFTVMKKV